MSIVWGGYCAIVGQVGSGTLYGGGHPMLKRAAAGGNHERMEGERGAPVEAAADYVQWIRIIYRAEGESVLLVQS